PRLVLPPGGAGMVGQIRLGIDRPVRVGHDVGVGTEVPGRDASRGVRDDVRPTELDVDRVDRVATRLAEARRGLRDRDRRRGAVRVDDVALAEHVRALTRLEVLGARATVNAPREVERLATQRILRGVHDLLADLDTTLLDTGVLCDKRLAALRNVRHRNLHRARRQVLADETVGRLDVDAV